MKLRTLLLGIAVVVGVALFMAFDYLSQFMVKPDGQ